MQTQGMIDVHGAMQPLDYTCQHRHPPRGTVIHPLVPFNHVSGEPIHP